MSNRYRVSIPVEAAIQDGIDVSITHNPHSAVSARGIIDFFVERSQES